MAILNRYNSFRAALKTNKDAQPLGGGSAEWDEYFHANPGKVLAGALALQKLGEEAVIDAQGALYAEARYRQQRLELVMSAIGRGMGRTTRHLLDTKEDLARARGEKYLKLLKGFLKRFPVDLSHVETPRQEELFQGADIAWGGDKAAASA